MKCDCSTYYIEGIELYCTKCFNHIPYYMKNKVKTVVPKNMLPITTNEILEAKKCAKSMKEKLSRWRNVEHYKQYNNNYYRSTKSQNSTK